MERTGLLALPNARMSDMRILLIGVNDSRKDFVFDVLAECSIQVYAAGPLPEDKMKGRVKKYVVYDQHPHDQEHLYCDVVVQKIYAEIGDVDGCLCLWDAEVPFAALVTSRLGKPGMSPSGAMVAKSKALTQQFLGQSFVKDERDGSKLCFSRFLNVDDRETRSRDLFCPLLPSFGGHNKLGEAQNGVSCVTPSSQLTLLCSQHPPRNCAEGGVRAKGLDNRQNAASCVPSGHLRDGRNGTNCAASSGQSSDGLTAVKWVPPVPPSCAQRPPCNCAEGAVRIRGLSHLHEGHSDINCLQYSSLCWTIDKESEVEESVRKVGLPAVLKAEFGAGSMGVKLVHSLQEAADQYNHIQALHAQHEDRAYILGGDYSKSCVLMEYLEGSEHCVDLALFHGELVCAFVSDKGPQIPPDVFKTVITMPSRLPEDKLESVITAAFECCLALGLGHGMFDVDIMLTKSGPKLLEINPRMGGFCQREFILQCYKVDPVHLACMIACDIKPNINVPKGLSSIQSNSVVPPICCYVIGMYCYPWIHGKALKTTATPEILNRLHDDQQLIFIQHEPCLRELDHETPFCTVAVTAETFGKARERLVALCGEIGLETDGLSVNALLDFFTDNSEHKKDPL